MATRETYTRTNPATGATYNYYADAHPEEGGNLERLNAARAADPSNRYKALGGTIYSQSRAGSPVARWSTVGAAPGEQENRRVAVPNAGASPARPTGTVPAGGGYRPGATTSTWSAYNAPGGAAAAGSAGPYNPNAPLRDTLKSQFLSEYMGPNARFGLSDEDASSFLERGVGEGAKVFNEAAKARGMFGSNLDQPEVSRMVGDVNKDLVTYNNDLIQRQKDSLREFLMGGLSEEEAYRRMQEENATARSVASGHDAASRYASDQSLAGTKYGADKDYSLGTARLGEEGRQYDYDYGLRSNAQTYGQGLSTRQQEQAEREFAADYARNVENDFWARRYYGLTY